MMNKNKLKWIFQVFLCVFTVIQVGKFESSINCQETNKKIPNVGASFIRKCLPNQYFDDDENRCEFIPGGGIHLQINKTEICILEKYISDCENLSRYAICRSTKTIYAECPGNWKFSIRLKRCVINANPSKFCASLHSSSTKKPIVTPYVPRRSATTSDTPVEETTKMSPNSDSTTVKLMENKSSAIMDVSTPASITTDDQIISSQLTLASTTSSEAKTKLSEESTTTESTFFSTWILPRDQRLEMSESSPKYSTAEQSTMLSSTWKAETTGGAESTVSQSLLPKRSSTIEAERSTAGIENTPSSDFSSTSMTDTTMPHDLSSLIKKTTLNVDSFSTQSNIAEIMTSGKGASLEIAMTGRTNDPSSDYTLFVSTEPTRYPTEFDLSTVSEFTDSVMHHPTSHSTVESTIGTSSGNAMLAKSTLGFESTTVELSTEEKASSMLFTSREERTTSDESVSAKSDGDTDSTTTRPLSVKEAPTTEDKIFEQSTVIMEDTSSTVLSSVSAVSSNGRTSNHDLTSLITGSTLNSASITEDETSSAKSTSEKSTTTKRASEGSTVDTTEFVARPEDSPESTISETAATDADSPTRHSSTASMTRISEEISSTTSKSTMGFRSTTMGPSSAESDSSSSSTEAYDQMSTSVMLKTSVARSDSSIINSSTENPKSTESFTKKSSTEDRADQNDMSTTVISTNSVGYSGDSIVYSSTKEPESTEKSSALTESYNTRVSSSSVKSALLSSSTAHEVLTRDDKTAEKFTTSTEEISTPTLVNRTTLALADETTIEPEQISTSHKDVVYEPSKLSTIFDAVPVSSEANTKIFKLSTLDFNSTTMELTTTVDEEYKSSSALFVTELSSNPRLSTDGNTKTTIGEITTTEFMATEKVTNPSSIPNSLKSSTAQILASSEPSSLTTVSEVRDLTTKQPSASLQSTVARDDIDPEFATTFEEMLSTVSHGSSAKISTPPTSSLNNGTQLSTDGDINVSNSASTIVIGSSTIEKSSDKGEMSSVSAKYSEKMSTEPYEGSSTTVVNDLLVSESKASSNQETTSGTDLTAASPELSTSKPAITEINRSTEQSSTAKEAISDGSNYASTSVVPKMLTSSISSTAFESTKKFTTRDSQPIVSDSTTPLSIVSGRTETSLEYPVTEQSTVPNSESTRIDASTQERVSSLQTSSSSSASVRTATLPSSVKDASTVSSNVLAVSLDGRTSNHDLTSLISGSTLNSATTRSATTEDETPPDKSTSEKSATTKRASEGSSVHATEFVARPEDSPESTISETAATDADSPTRHSSTTSMTRISEEISSTTSKSTMGFRSTTMGPSSAERDSSSSSTEAYDQISTSVMPKTSVAHLNSSVINSSTENPKSTESFTKKSSTEDRADQNDMSTTLISTNSVGYSGNSIVYSSTKEPESTEKSSASTESMTNLQETSTKSYSNRNFSSSAKSASQSSTAQQVSTRDDKTANQFTTITEETPPTTPESLTKSSTESTVTSSKLPSTSSSINMADTTTEKSFVNLHSTKGGNVSVHEFATSPNEMSTSASIPSASVVSDAHTTTLLDSTSKISSISGLNSNNATQTSTTNEATTKDLPLTSASDYLTMISLTSLIKGSTLNVQSSTAQSLVATEGKSSSEKTTSDTFLTTEKPLEQSTLRTLDLSTENTSRTANPTDISTTTSDALILSKSSTTEQFPTALSELTPDIKASTVSSEEITTQSSDRVDAAVTGVQNVLNVTEPHETESKSSLLSTTSVQSSSRVTSVVEFQKTVQQMEPSSELTARSNGFEGSSSSAATLTPSVKSDNDSVTTPMPVAAKSSESVIGTSIRDNNQRETTIMQTTVDGNEFASSSSTGNGKTVPIFDEISQSNMRDARGTTTSSL